MQGDANERWDVFVHQCQPASHTLSGRVTFEGLAPSSVAPRVCVFEFRYPGTTMAVWAALAWLDDQGNFLLQGPAPDGPYDLAVKRTRWLRKVVSIDTSQGDVTDVYVGLSVGDIDEDNEVAIGDYAILSTAYGSSLGDFNWYEPADLDGDGEVSIGDFALLSQNFALFGDD